LNSGKPSRVLQRICGDTIECQEKKEVGKPTRLLKKRKGKGLL